MGSSPEAGLGVLGERVGGGGAEGDGRILY
jgi:hypothetical protein